MKILPTFGEFDQKFDCFHFRRDQRHVIQWFLIILLSRNFWNHHLGRHLLPIRDQKHHQLIILKVILYLNTMTSYLTKTITAMQMWRKDSQTTWNRDQVEILEGYSWMDGGSQKRKESSIYQSLHVLSHLTFIGTGGTKLYPFQRWEN